MKKNIDIPWHILMYCEDIGAALEHFGREKDIFDTDRDYRNSVCMSLLQIGELTGHLTEDFREGTKDFIYWPAIKGMRNLFAHNYGAVDVGLVWETAVSDIPVLHEFCERTIRMFRFLEQEEAQDGGMEPGFRVFGVNPKNSTPDFTGERHIFHYTFLFDAYRSM